MKRLAGIVICFSTLAAGAFAQGLVNFLNSETTLSSAIVNAQWQPTSGAVGSWYYALLIAPPGTTDPALFTFAGLYATNLLTPGRFSGGVGVAANGWAPGATMSYEIAMWGAGLGVSWNPVFLAAFEAGRWGDPVWNHGGSYFGLSEIATGVSGGVGNPPSPPYDLFGSATGIQNGFFAGDISTVLSVPEPSNAVFVGLGAALLIIFRRHRTW